MRPNQGQFFKKILKLLAISLIALFAYYHPIVVLVLFLIIMGLGILLYFFLGRVMKWFEDIDFKHPFK